MLSKNRRSRQGQEGRLAQRSLGYLIHSSLIPDHDAQIVDVVLAHAKFKWIRR